MEHIIHHIAQELVEKIIKKAYSGKISDIDSLTENILADCKISAARVVETILAEMNLQIRQDKQARKEQGLVMKQKDSPRSLLMKLDTLYMTRDYYYDKVNESHVCILDKVIGIPAYERITGGVSAKLVSLTTEVSYAKSAQFGAVDAISRQSVGNKILKLGALEKRPDPKEEKRDVKELHVFAAGGRREMDQIRTGELCTKKNGYGRLSFREIPKKAGKPVSEEKCTAEDPQSVKRG